MSPSIRGPERGEERPESVPVTSPRAPPALWTELFSRNSPMLEG
jgi:hypothetical protein